MARPASPSAAASGSAAVPPPGPVFLVHGGDEYAVKQRARQVYQQWSNELGGMDHETIDAQVNNAGEALHALGRLREALQTLPFFGSGKCIWLQNCSFLSDDRTASSSLVTEALAELAQELKSFQWQSVRLLVSAGKVDKRKTFYKTLEKLGQVQEFEAWSIDDKDWATTAEAAAAKWIRARKKAIDDGALTTLVHQVGPNSQQLASEIEKLCLYVGDREEITVADVEAIVIRNKQARSFALAEAVGARQLNEALRCLDEELWSMQTDKKKSGIGLLYGLVTKFRTMLLLKEMIREGWLKADADYHRLKSQLERVPADRLPEDKKFNPLAMHPFMLHKALAQTQNYTTAELVQAMELLLACNQRLISSQLDESLILQQTLLRIIGGPTGSGSTTAARRPAPNAGWRSPSPVA